MWRESKQKTYSYMIWAEYGCTEILVYHVQYMNFLLGLIFYNALLQINIVPQCKDWSIFCFDLADDLVPCKTKSAKTRLENDRNDMDCWSPLITVDPQVKVWLFLSAYTVKMVSSDVRITGAVARQTDQTGLSIGRFNWNKILGDPGADSGGEGNSKRAGKYGTKKSKERREEPLGTMSCQTSSKRSPPLWLLIGQKNTKVFWHQSAAITAV